jgi:RNA polymerase sigma factor (sigma-70 family)
MAIRIPDPESGRESGGVSEVERKSLIDSHLGKVALVSRMLAARLPAWVDANELAQEGVIAMIEASERWDPAQGEFWPFVYRAVRGAMLDFLGRNCQHTCHVELSAVRVFAPDETGKLSRELDLARAMEKLTTQERRVFTALRAGHRPRRIAGMLNINESTVSRLRKRAIRRVKAELVA